MLVVPPSGVGRLRAAELGKLISRPVPIVLPDGETYLGHKLSVVAPGLREERASKVGVGAEAAGEGRSRGQRRRASERERGRRTKRKGRRTCRTT